MKLETLGATKDRGDMKLPQLAPHIQAVRGAPDYETGRPTLVLYNPVSGSHYRVKWAEAECLMRFGQHKTLKSLMDDIARTTTLQIEEDDIVALIGFLYQHGLTDPRDPSPLLPPQKPEGAFKWILHRYLYFTVPLLHPQEFLSRTLPFVAPLLSRGATIGIAVLWVIGLLMTVERWDEFWTTYPSLFSLEGLVEIAVIFAVIKLIHEWAHAYTATKYGVAVPHMGVAVMVMYPVLYTETSGAWKLENKWHRAYIGLAGIRAELGLAAIALLVWHISDTGSPLQVLSFMVVTVALISSLAVNLNPLMRFDGYYILSDVLGVENLQFRAIENARLLIRKIVFGQEAVKNDLDTFKPNRQTKFLTRFGLALLIYRMSLYAGIAALVFHMFPQPLGAILGGIEVWFFLLRPVITELKVWKGFPRPLWSSPRSRISAALLGAFIVLVILPLDTSVTTEAVLKSANEFEAFAPYPSHLDHLLVEDGQAVKKGDVIATLSSFELTRDRKLAQNDLDRLELKKRRQMSTTKGVRPEEGIDDRIKAAMAKIETLDHNQDNLVIRAPFSGTIRDMARGLSENTYVHGNQVLARVVDNSKGEIVAYVSEQDSKRLSIGASADFIPEMNPLIKYAATLERIDVINASSLSDFELASGFGGPVQGQMDRTKNWKPEQNMFRIVLKPADSAAIPADMRLKGNLDVSASYTSWVLSFSGRLIALLRRELALN